MSATTTPPPLVRVLVVDDHAMVAEALAALLDTQPDLDVIGLVTRAEAIVDSVTRDRPDVVLLDIVWPGADSFALVGAIRAAGARVLMVTAFGKPGYLHRALEAGATGFLVKDASAAELAAAIATVAAGGTVIGPHLPAAAACPLTPREMDVVRAAAAGGTVQDIARRVYLSPGTVRNHLSTAMAKLGAPNRMDAVRAAEDSGWL